MEKIFNFKIWYSLYWIKINIVESLIYLYFTAQIISVRYGSISFLKCRSSFGDGMADPYSDEWWSAVMMVATSDECARQLLTMTSPVPCPMGRKSISMLHTYTYFYPPKGDTLSIKCTVLLICSEKYIF